MGRLFGTNGVRGVVGDTMTPALAQRVGAAVGTMLTPGDRVALGTDARTSSPMIAATVTAALQAAGIDVVRLGVCPSPAIQYFVKTHDDVAHGVIITASHNPPQFNGIKTIAADGTETSAEEEAAVEDIYFAESFRSVPWDAVGGVSDDASANDAYRQAVLDHVDDDKIRKRKFKVIVDPAGGPGALVLPRLLEDLGCQVVTIHGELDGTFSGRKSEPKEENLGALIKKVKADGADLGLAQDGDADRCTFIDDRGEFVPGDESFAIVADHVVREAGGGTVCTPVSTSSLLDEVVDAAGGRVVTTAVGSPIVARRMFEEDAVFGGEENGGLIFPAMQHCRDGAMSAAAMLEILAARDTTLSALRDALPEYHVVKRSFECPEDRKTGLLKRLKEAYGTRDDVRVDDTDGVKVYYEDGAWVLIRPSGTEPIYRVYAESKDASRAEDLAREALEEAGGLLAA